MFSVEFYEEALSLLYELTCKEVTPELWGVLELIYEVMEKYKFILRKDNYFYFNSTSLLHFFHRFSNEMVPIILWI